MEINIEDSDACSAQHVIAFGLRLGFFLMSACFSGSVTSASDSGGLVCFGHQIYLVHRNLDRFNLGPCYAYNGLVLCFQ